LKPYKFIEDRTLILAKPNDLVTNEHVQTNLNHYMLIMEKCEPIEFEPINNYLTHGNIIGTNVPIHYHKDVHVEFNYVLNYND
jgi:hypothetical protein